MVIASTIGMRVQHVAHRGELRVVLQSWYPSPRCGIECMVSSLVCWVSDLSSSGTGVEFAVPTGHGGMQPHSEPIRQPGRLPASDDDLFCTSEPGPGRCDEFEALQEGFFAIGPSPGRCFLASGASFWNQKPFQALSMGWGALFLFFGREPSLARNLSKLLRGFNF